MFTKYNLKEWQKMVVMFFVIITMPIWGLGFILFFVACIPVVTFCAFYEVLFGDA